MKQELETHIAEVCKNEFDVDVTVELDIPDEKFGDYTTNIAMRLAGTLGENPRSIAEKVVSGLSHDAIGQTEIAGPGFINITLTDNALTSCVIEDRPSQIYANKTVVAEYSDPNPFKVLHAGHLYTSIVGDAIANLIQAAGARVVRVNFGGDVGLHVAKTMFAIIGKLGGEHPEKLSAIPKDERSEWLADAYIAGTNAYEDDESAKTEIVQFNKRIYEILKNNDHQSSLAQIYWTTRQWSYDYFYSFYERIGTTFDTFYPESECAEIGYDVVMAHVGTVFSRSNGAVIFEGEKYGLHTRVFINSEGLPTYETKDVGLIYKKKEDFGFDYSVIITGNEQLQYMEVVLKAIEQLAPELANASTHLTHGIVKLEGAQKMSSRKGNILRAVDVISFAQAAGERSSVGGDERITLSAIKYAFLKTRMGGDIIYNPEESVSLHGNSGPYLQYALVRARSILSKATTKIKTLDAVELTPQERTVVRKMSHFSGVIDEAVLEMAPHGVCSYLFELAQTFNRFYESNRIIGDARETVRLQLLGQYADIMERGLALLGIEAVESM